VLRALITELRGGVEYSTLKQQAWGGPEVSDAAVDMAIRRMRQKLNQDTPEHEGDGLIRSHRGIDYSISSS